MHYITLALIFVTWAGLIIYFLIAKKLKSYQLLLLSKLWTARYKWETVNKFKKLHNTNEVHVHTAQ